MGLCQAVGNEQEETEGYAERAINKTIALLISVGQRQWGHLSYNCCEQCTYKNKPEVLG